MSESEEAAEADKKAAASKKKDDARAVMTTPYGPSDDLTTFTEDAALGKLVRVVCCVVFVVCCVLFWCECVLCCVVCCVCSCVEAALNFFSPFFVCVGCTAVRSADDQPVCHVFS